MEVDLGKRGVTHDSGGAGVVCGPGPKPQGPQKPKNPQKGQKKTPAVLRFCVCVSIRKGGKIGFKKCRVKQKKIALFAYICACALTLRQYFKAQVECLRVLLLSLLLLLSFLSLSLLSDGCLLPHEILPIKVTAEYELDK